MRSAARKNSSRTSKKLYWDGEDNLGTVVFDVASLEESLERARAAFRGEPQGSHISFASAEQLFSIMTPKRLAMVRTMAGAGPLSIREVARRLGRDVKAVHSDVHALLRCGVLSRTREGQVIFPFNAVHVNVMIEAAA